MNNNSGHNEQNQKPQKVEFCVSKFLTKSLNTIRVLSSETILCFLKKITESNNQNDYLLTGS